MTSPQFVMSKVHRRFNLLLCAGCSIGFTRGLGWDTSAVRCLWVQSWMAVRTNGICRSEWSVWLVTYQGKLVMIRRSSDWYRCIIAILDLLAQPHSTMPLLLVKLHEYTLSVNGNRIILCFVDRACRHISVMKRTWCTIYSQFIQSLYLYMFRVC
jgi:hypothetical protein